MGRDLFVELFKNERGFGVDTDKICRTGAARGTTLRSQSTEIYPWQDSVSLHPSA
jgi:hypothetical protein